MYAPCYLTHKMALWEATLITSVQPSSMSEFTADTELESEVFTCPHDSTSVGVIGEYRGVDTDESDECVGKSDESYNHTCTLL